MRKQSWILCSVFVVAGLACDGSTSPSGTGGSKEGGKGSGGMTAQNGGAPSSGGSASGGAVAGAQAGGNAGGGTATGGVSTTGGSSAAGTQSGGSTGIPDAGSGGSSDKGGSSGSGGSTGSTGGSTGTPPVPTNEPIGWATFSSGTTGGGNATPVTVSSMGELNSAAGGDGPKVIHVAAGNYSGSLKVGANKTIIGAPGTVIKSGGNTLTINGNNVIIRNIAFKGSPDGSADMALIPGKNHIWFDHLELVDGGDGMLDIVGGGDHITISWTKFYYTAKTAHQNAILLSSSNGSGDTGKNNITFHHNWFAENIAERTPRVRFGKVHIFNNLYTATLGFSYYAIRCGYKANVRTENNIFKDFKGIVKFDENFSKSGESLAFSYHDGSPDSVLESIGDVFVNCTERAVDGDGTEGGTFSKGGPAFKPPYDYSLDPTDTLEAAVRAGAGPTLKLF